MKASYRRAGRQGRGFTLVELLAVIAIIALLITILVPAVNAVRRNARQAATKSILSTIETGIETFRGDSRIGGALPPSASDATGGKALRCRNPYKQLTNSGSDYIRMTGGGLLVWALAGADLLGSPGFRTTRSESEFWANDTDAGPVQDNNYGLYSLTDSGTPKVSRSAPYVDLSKVKVSTFNQAANGFVIEAEARAREASGKPAASRTHPLFLDGYGFPILYWRADPAGVRVADFSAGKNPVPPTGENRGIYHFNDNSNLLGKSGAELQPSDPVLILSATGEPDSKIHKIKYLAPASGTTPKDAFDDPKKLQGFWRYTWNKDVAARFTPRRSDSYLLVSAGEDGIYGTADDIANFEHNGAETAREDQP